MNLKFFAKSFPFFSLSSRKGGSEMKTAEEPSVTLSFSPGKGQREGSQKAPYTIRTVRACELHRTRSLLALGNCAMYCLKSCRLADADTREDMNG